MSAIDERVVHMQFDNAAFERNVQQTLRSLEALNKKLQLQGAAKGLQSIGSTASKQGASLQNLENSAQAVESRFSKMQVIATTALATIAHKVTEVSGRVLKSFTLDPVIEGFREYETNLNSIQTILANTRAAGTKLSDVTGALDELNHYSDQTIYNFSEMAKNIGTFTAAGVGLNESVAAIKGIANLAAISGSNSEQASGAMYQLSQAISAGRVSLEDWNSVVNAGMGGTVFQRALAQNAVALGTLNDGAVKLKGDMKNVTIEGKSFRESITAKPGQESWLTSKVLTQTLAQFTGDLTDAELAAQGFSKAQIKAIQDQARTAKAAATEVKTATQLFGTFREQLTSGWAQTWQIIFGDFTEAKGLFTGVSDSIGKLLQESSDGRNEMLKDWDKLGGRTALIDGIANALKALVSILKPIKDAFREIFPATTGKQLYEMTVTFRDFMERLKLGDQTANNLRRTFAGFFAILGIGWEILKQVAKTIFGLFGEVGKGSGGFLKTTASIGDFLVALHKAVKEGDGLRKFFQGIGKVLAVPIKLIAKLAGYLGDLFSGNNAGAGKQVGELTSKLEPMARLGEMVSNAWERVGDVMDKVWSGVQKVGSKVASFFDQFGSGVADSLRDLDLGDVFAGINTGLFAGLVLMLKNFLGGGGGGGVLEGITDAIEGFTGVLKGMQNTLNAAALLQIAIAVGILAVSMNTLSKIDAAGLTRAGTTISVMFAQLLGAMVIFNKFIGVAGFAKLPFVMGSLILLAGAILVLTQAVKQLSELSWEELAKGLTGLAVTLGLLVGSLKLMPNPKGLISTSFGMIALAAAIKILASAVTDLAGLDWNELAKGLVGVGAVLGALVLFTMFSKVNKAAPLQGLGIILLAAGIKILASAVKDMAQLSWVEMAKGLLTLAGALAIIVAAVSLIPPNAALGAAAVVVVAISLGLVAKALAVMGQMGWGGILKSLVLMLGSLGIIAVAASIIPPSAVAGAAAILIVSIALKQIAGVLQTLGEFSWGEILKSMVLLAGTLTIIAAAMLFMTGALPGAAATLVIASALSILAPVLMQFGQMSLGEIGKSLLMLAGIFVVFGAAAILLSPVVPVMIALAAAVTLLGIGVLAAGAGVLLFATALTALAAAGIAGTAAIVGIVSGLAGLIPLVLKQLALGIKAFAEVIGTAGPAMLKAIRAVLNALIDAIAQLTPKIVNTLLKMMLAMTLSMLKYVPRMVDAGLKLLTGILRGIANNIGKVVDSATKVVVNFLNAIGRNIPKVIQAGVNLIIKFIDGVTRAIDNNSARLGAAGGRLAAAIVKGMIRGLGSGLGEIISAARNVAESALTAAKRALGVKSPSKEFEKIGRYVNDGFRKGLDGNKKQVFDAFDTLKFKLKDMARSAGDDVDRLEAKLKKLRNKRDRNETRKDLSKARREERASKAAYAELTKRLDDERNKLGKLADKYDVLSDRIKKAKDKLADAIKTRNDYNKQVREQYSDMPSATGETKVVDFISDLKKQVEDTKVFANALQRLRKLGLNDEMYKDLLATGTSALPFVQELLAGGKSGVDEINKLNKQLDKAGALLGKTASSNLYQAAVDSAAGFVKGLEKEQKNIEKQMDKIADAMVKAIKKKLGIKSPSVVFAEVGKWTAKGLGEGMRKSTPLIQKSAEGMGQTAVDSLRKSLSNMADMVTGDIDMKPVLTPVLDLSRVRKEAGKLGGILGDKTISLDGSYSKAKSISDDKMDNRRLDRNNGSDPRTPPMGGVTYNQYNNSPKTLSSAEIYRQTKNQLSTAKGALST